MACFFNQYKEKQIVYQEVREPVEVPSSACSSLTSSAERSTLTPIRPAPWEGSSLSFLSLPERMVCPACLGREGVKEEGKGEGEREETGKR